MRRRDRHRLDRWRHVRLYLDQVEEIYDLLVRECQNVTLTAGSYELDSASELSEVPDERVRELDIEAMVPRVSLRVRGDDVSLSYSEDTQSVGIAAQVREIALRHRRLVTRWPIWQVLIVATTTAGFYAVALGTDGEWLVAAILGALTVGLFGALLAQMNESISRNSVVILARRGEHPNFWQRNRDQLLIVLISNILSGVVGFALGFALGTLR